MTSEMEKCWIHCDKVHYFMYFLFFLFIFILFFSYHFKFRLIVWKESHNQQLMLEYMHIFVQHTLFQCLCWYNKRIAFKIRLFVFCCCCFCLKISCSKFDTASFPYFFFISLVFCRVLKKIQMSSNILQSPKMNFIEFMW